MPERGELDFITGDRGSVEITWEMQMQQDFPDKAGALEQIMIRDYPHLEFEVWKSINDNRMVIEWRPRPTPTENP